MAKGNLFLGTASGSVGDVVMSVSRGKQISRVRRRTIKNPESDGQILTRAILSTVSKAYSQGIAIFDHSFQGLAVGQDCQNRFLEVNMGLLRNAYNADIANNVEPFLNAGRFVSKNAATTVPFSFVVSEGKITQNFFTLIGKIAEGESYIALSVPVPLANETVKAYMERNGLVTGDIYTLVGFTLEDLGVYSATDSAQTYFGFVRMIVRDVTAIADTPIDGFTLADIFLAEYQVPFGILRELDGYNWDEIQAGEQIDVRDLGFNGFGAFGVIRSRDDSGVRSYCRLTPSFIFDGLQGEDYQWGVTSRALLASWRGESISFDSPLILEGGDIEAAIDR